MKVELENVKPMDIEKRSFEIITEELGDTPLVPGTELVVKRCIHTSADFDYAKNLCFSQDVIEKAMDAIRNGACIVTNLVSTNVHLPVTEAKYTVLCPMRMWQSLQRSMEPQEQQRAWTRLPLLTKS